MSVGARVANLDWAQRTDGSARYTADVSLPGTVVARVLRSPHPHARILSIDVTAAARASGVVGTLTARDLPDQRYVHNGGPLSDRYPLARDVVRYIGEEVAVVAAETVEQADAALRLIAVAYRPLPAVTTIADALADGAPLVHDGGPAANVALRLRHRYGDAAAGRRRAVTTVTGRYRTGRQTQASMEPNTVLARWDEPSGRLELWVSTQAPYFIRKEVAHALELPIESVIVHEVAVGGGFGSKAKISEHEVLAAALARKAGRPVRLTLRRDEEFAATKPRHEFEIEMETGADRDGRLTHRDARMRVDNGAYNHSGPGVAVYASLLAGSMYRTSGVDVDADLVYTNKQPGGSFRGFGGPQVTFAVESQVDELAERVGMDPIDLRILNATRTGDVTHAGWRILSAALVECLESARELIGWDEKRELGGTGRGVGIAAAMHVTGAHVSAGADQASAGVGVGPDGRVQVRYGGADAGTWQETVLAQIAATELGVDPSAVEVLTMETGETPPDLGAWSSRGTFMSGNAVRAAARSAADTVRSHAAEKFGVPAAEVVLAEGLVVVGDDRVPLGDMLGPLEHLVDGELRVDETYTAPMEPVNLAEGISNVAPSYSFAVHAVEVEVDRDTGEVTVLDVVAAHDSGTAINPAGVAGQIYGGVAMGLGAALGEELIYEGGRLVNPAYISYPLPRARDLPPIRPVVIERPDPLGPYGAKGIGEITLIPTAAAVANAVAHAVGVRVRELPITPDKVLAGLHAQQGRRRSFNLWRRPDRWWVAALRWSYPRGLHTALHRYGTRLARMTGPVTPDQLVRPTTVKEAVELLSAPAAVPIAGGTDLLPARAQGLVRPLTLVDVSTVRSLSVTSETDAGDLRVGAGVSLADLLRSAHLHRDQALRKTVSMIASPQIREMATVGGNLCQQKRCWFYRNGFTCYKRGGVTCPCYAVDGDNRFYHAVAGAHRCQAVTPSDLATTLTALDARIGVAGPGGARTIGIERFFVGPGETALQPRELLVDALIPAGARRRTTRYEKLRLWEGDFAVVSVCASIAFDPHGRVADSRVVLGAVAPTPYRATATERAILGRRLDQRTVAAASQAWASHAHPLRGNAWKVEAACGLVARCLSRCAPGAPQGSGHGRMR